MNKLGEQEIIIVEEHFPVTIYLNDDREDVDIHWHDFIEILYQLEGTSTAIVNGKRYSLETKDSIFIHSQESHSTEDTSNGTYIVLQFSPNILLNSADNFFESKYFLPFLVDEPNESRLITEKQDRALSFLLQEMFVDFNERYEGYELNIKGNLYKIFSKLIKNKTIIIPHIYNMDRLGVEKMMPLLEYVHNNYKTDITSKKASELTHFGYHHFCRTFKKITGKTFVEYLNFIRLGEAEKLLLATNKTVTDIALEVGFSHVSYFSRLFKREKGLTPIHYRKQFSSKTKQ